MKRVVFNKYGKTTFMFSIVIIMKLQKDRDSITWSIFLHRAYCSNYSLRIRQYCFSGKLWRHTQVNLHLINIEDNLEISHHDVLSFGYTFRFNCKAVFCRRVNPQIDQRGGKTPYVSAFRDGIFQGGNLFTINRNSYSMRIVLLMRHRQRKVDL